MERDENQCQFPAVHDNHSYKPCGRDGGLQIHHIIPQRWAYAVMHLLSKDVDTPENGITLCPIHHTQVIHTDMPLAKGNYQVDKQSYEKVFDKRDELVGKQTVYWNTAYDNLMKRVAESRNKLFKQKGGGEFPR